MFISNKNQAETVDNKGFLQSLSYQAFLIPFLAQDFTKITNSSWKNILLHPNSFHRLIFTISSFRETIIFALKSKN